MLQIIKNTIHNLTIGEKRTLIVLVFCSLLISVLDIAFVAFLLFIIGFYANQYQDFNNNILEIFYHYKLLLAILFLALFAIKNIAAYLIFRQQFGFVYKVSSRISKQNLYKYLNGNYSDYSHVDSSVHIRKTSYQPIEFCHYVLAGLQQIFTEIVLACLAIVAILIYNPKLFLLLLIALLPPVIFITYITRRRLKEARENVKIASEKSLQHLQEALAGFVESNIYGKNDFFTQRYFRSQNTLNSYLSSIHSIQGAPARLIETFAVFGFFLLIAANYYWNNSQVLGIINIGAFVAAAYKIIPSIVKILNLAGQVKTYSYTIPESHAKAYIYQEENTLKLNNVLSAVEFKNVNFSYKSHSILQDFNLKIEAGNFVGISGASGKGKTTIINLLLGFFSPDKGDILLNSEISDESKRKYFWPNIAIVKQHPFVIADSVFRNIILDDSNYDKERLEKAIKAAGLESILKKYPKGLQKQITENSKNISGGQQQRIILARAFYKNADLLILDEPFSELDKESEEIILTHVKELAKTGKMIIFISHNKNSLSFCDKVISLDE